NPIHCYGEHRLHWDLQHDDVDRTEPEGAAMTESMFELSAGHRALQRRARQLAAAAAPLAAEADEATSFLPEVRALLAESGLVGYVVPREYGGVSDRVDPLAVTVIREALAVESSHLDSMFAMQGI